MDLILILVILVVVGLKSSPSPYYQELEYIEKKLYPPQPRQPQPPPQQPSIQPQQFNNHPQPPISPLPQKPPTVSPKPPTSPPKPPTKPMQDQSQNLFGDSGFGSFEDVLAITLDESAFSDLDKNR